MLSADRAWRRVALRWPGAGDGRYGCLGLYVPTRLGACVVRARRRGRARLADCTRIAAAADRLIRHTHYRSDFKNIQRNPSSVRAELSKYERTRIAWNSPFDTSGRTGYCRPLLADWRRNRLDDCTAQRLGCDRL